MARNAKADCGKHELALAKGQYLPADGARHIGHIDDADDEDGQPQRARLDGDDAEVQPLRDQHDRERDGEEIDREGPENVEEARYEHVDDAAEIAGGQAHERGEEQRHHGRHAGNEQRVEAAVEQAGHHVTALIVGAEEIVAELPGGADGRVAEAQTFCRLLHHRNVLAVDLDHGIERRAEGIGVGPGGIGGGKQADNDDENEDGQRENGGAVSEQAAESRGPGATALRSCDNRVGCSGQNMITSPRTGRPSSRTAH